MACEKDVDLKSLVQGRTQLWAVGGGQTDGGREGLDLPAFAVRTINQETRQIRVLASSAALDRYNERILPSAFKNSISAFMMNPCVLAAHAHRLDDGQPPVVGSYWQLYSQGYMRAVSVGFLVVSYEDKEEDGRHVRVYTEVTLLEISCVAIPANPEALVRSGGGR